MCVCDRLKVPYTQVLQISSYKTWTWIWEQRGSIMFSAIKKLSNCTAAIFVTGDMSYLSINDSRHISEPQ